MLKHHSIAADLMKAARQESAWAKSALSEGVDEDKRARLWEKRGYTAFANELKWDADIAKRFYLLRKDRSKQYTILANKIKHEDKK